jgi:CDP-2,3-bis-(O-geranylgeranyl)-sn-glycerol synthase
MWHDIASLIWIFMPVGLANTGPVIANNISILKNFNQPLDFHKTYRGKRIFGDHKTIRGLIAGMTVGMLVIGLQMLLVKVSPALQNYAFDAVNYGSVNTLLVGLAMGFGALAGDVIKSFFKRQMNIDPGKSWVPFDQIDFIVGGALASTFFFTLPANIYLFGLIIGLVLHPAFNILAWLLRLQDKPF